MGKYRYRATHLHEVNWDGVRGQIAEEPRVVLAIDVAKEAMVATLMRVDREVLVTLKWSHPRESRSLLERLSELGSARVEAVLEPSGTYGDALRGLLEQAGLAIYRISPKRVHDAAEVYDGVPSLHDAKAAYVIGRLHLEGVSQRWVSASASRQSWRAELALLDWYGSREQQGRNRLEALLARHWPEAPTVLELGSVSLLSLLAEYGSPAAVAAEAEAAAALLRRRGRSGLKAEKVTALLASARTTVGVPCLASERRLIQVLADETLAARRQCTRIERELEAQVPVASGLAQQAAAVGSVTAVVLYCALGEADGYGDAASYLKAAGLNLKERSSGKYQGQLKLTKRGPGVARRYLYYAALRLIGRNGPARQWYEAKVARDGGVKSKAITALMRKLTRALWHVGLGAAFEEARLFGCEARRQAA